jgi:hypothetical protein
MTLQKTTLTFLKICFYLNVLAFLNTFIIIATTSSNVQPAQEYINSTPYRILSGTGTIFSLGALILWGYCIYFYYKFDKYFKGGLGLIFLPGLISPFYFYKVIWKQKRPLQNK